MVEFFAPPQLEKETFQKYKELIYEKAGITLSNEKTEFLKGRIYKRLRRLGINNFEDYFKHITNPGNVDEFTEFLNVISTNVTHFFRENQHFDFLKNEVIPKFLDQPEINIWSAGCSNGAEPYSLSITFMEYFIGKAKKPHINIYACDLSHDVLHDAILGVYDEEILRNVPENLLKKYFKTGVNEMKGKYKVQEILRKSVKFYQHNLLNPFQVGVKFDIVFCRNVMIYFDNTVKTQVVRNIFNVLKEGGYFFTGHSESMIGLANKRPVAPSVYLND
ncbi:MAG: protein-glutamate O-methyltransferase CheR [Candidatus Margulisbacteria bacterium]|nr:protein-glutamate O-methyltransferase CheR [Candidatus Margulisiibacteriota bacterium]